MRRIFWGFCRNWFLIDPLHYFSSLSHFDFEFAEIFIVGELASRGVANSPTQRVRESSWWVGESLFKFFINYHWFSELKQLNQPFKRSIWQKRSQGFNVLSPLIYLKVWKKLYLQAILSACQSGSHFSITNISANSKPKSEQLEM